jgi:DNA-binding Xre family transcriptional regulator
MSQSSQLIATLKRLLKARNITYAMVGRTLGLSEASVKRQFSQQRFTLETLEAICSMLDIDFAELARDAERGQTRLARLSAAQEAELVASPTLLLLAVCVINHWPFEQIVSTYRLSAAECVQGMLKLDKLGLIQLMPENRVRLKIARDFNWLPDGPIHRFFRSQMQADFLDSPFQQGDELLRFQRGMLSTAAMNRLRVRLERVLQEFADLHEDCVDEPSSERHGVSLLLATRSWEPKAFEALRRAPIAE